MNRNGLNQDTDVGACIAKVAHQPKDIEDIFPKKFIHFLITLESYKLIRVSQIDPCPLLIYPFTLNLT